MKPSLEPFTTMLDFLEGTLEPEGQVVERRLGDMRGIYQEDSDGNDATVVYRVYPISVPKTNSEIQCSTTVLAPGLVGDEYFMTKGHFHRVRERSEVYLGLSGGGRLVMATEDGQHMVEPMGPGTINYIPGGWAHRSVNVGREPLVFFAAYVGDAGHDYRTIQETGFPVMVVKGRHGPRLIENPRYSRSS